jgi:hypothetical protein
MTTAYKPFESAQGDDRDVMLSGVEALQLNSLIAYTLQSTGLRKSMFGVPCSILDLKTPNKEHPIMIYEVFFIMKILKSMQPTAYSLIA